MITCYDHPFLFQSFKTRNSTGGESEHLLGKISNQGHHNRSRTTICNYLKNVQSDITGIKPVEVT